MKSSWRDEWRHTGERSEVIEPEDRQGADCLEKGRTNEVDSENKGGKRSSGKQSSNC